MMHGAYNIKSTSTISHDGFAHRAVVGITMLPAPTNSEIMVKSLKVGSYMRRKKLEP